MKTVFSDDMELKFIEIWHGIILSRQGTMTSQQEKIDIAVQELNKYAATIGQEPLSAKQVKNKIDSLKKKAKLAYKTVRIKTTTGTLVEDDYDLEVRIQNTSTTSILGFELESSSMTVFSRSTCL